MSGRRMCHAREPALVYQLLVCLRPGWDSVAGWGQWAYEASSHHSTRRGITLACGAVPRNAFITRSLPTQSRSRTCDERLKGVFHQETQLRARLALTKKCLPHEWWKIPHRANAKTRDGREHGSLF